jgi:hypothetical protein
MLVSCVLIAQVRDQLAGRTRVDPERDDRMSRLTSLLVTSGSRPDPVVCENSGRGLRGVTIIEFEHAAEALTALDRAQARRRRSDALVVQPLVRPFLVIEVDNTTPTIPSLERCGTRGIRGLVGSSRCTKR